MEDKKEKKDIVGKIVPRILETELKQSYLSYAMSVIVSRALPDVRDGLKPVHRRVLYAMGEMGLRSTAKFRKSATVVGEVLGKYHPHGDVATYETLVRMAQDFAMRYPLIKGQGNFGSIDGDSAAAHRYTEAKMAKIADEMLTDIDKDTVDFMPNYDNRLQEPKVLPSKIPQLLLNGTVGIAVGMATSIPPHNLNEVMGALLELMDNPEATLEDLMEHIKGPDFPTGGVLYNPEDIKAAYETGKGRAVIRAVAEIEDTKRGFRIIVSEIPYQVNKSNLIEKMAELAKGKKLIGISDIRDESDKDGIRIVIELKKDSYPKKILNQLFKLTQMQSTFYINLLALVNGIQPKVLNLKSILQYFIDHRKDVVSRRTKYELNKAKERAHVLEGLKIALENLDAVIKTIRQSRTKEDAHANLIKKFKLSEIQATAILEMRLQALAGLERQKVEDEHKEKQKFITELKAILADPKKILAIIKKETIEIKDKYSDERRTKIVKQTLGEFSEKDLVPNENVVVTITRGGYIKRQPIDAYKAQRRGGKGVIGMTTKEEDQIEKIQVAKNHDDILFFTNRGRVFKQRVYEVPKSLRIAKGTAMVNLIQLAPEERVTGILISSEYKPNDNLVMVTRRGIIKKTSVDKYTNIRTSGLIAIKLDEKDELAWVRMSRKGDTVMIITKKGQAIHFKEEDARLLGRSTRGVRGIRLKAGDEVVAADVAPDIDGYALLVIANKGLGKRTSLSKYTLQKRGGSGLKTLNITDRTGEIINARLVAKNLKADVILTSKNGQVIRLSLSSIPMLGRVTQGVTLMRMKGNDKVASFTIFVVDEEGLPVEGKIDNNKSVKSIKKIDKPVEFVKKSSKSSKSGGNKTTGFSKRKIVTKASSVKQKSRIARKKSEEPAFKKRKAAISSRTKAKSKSRLTKKILKIKKSKK